MAKVTMTIHRALGELKTYNDRIFNAINATFVASNKKSNEKINGKTVKELEQAIQGNFDSVKTLIENKKRIKAAVVASNAAEKVTIAGKEYSKADAIERKAAIVLEEKFLMTLKRQFNAERTKVENENNQLQTKLENYLQSVLGDKASRSAAEIEEHTKSFMSKNTYELIDPVGVESYIKTLENDILNFKNEVDYVLSESNATTVVEVDLVD